ncbi:MAG: hypothetical protein EU535_00885 [Promethearchaeota archaeon]|nr:MAG: hypothetical protein EU535_00885 [Candidatus Lokiarchaeota archaeon]
MPEEKIIVIGDEDIVLLLGLLGIDGITIETADDFMIQFNKLISNPAIGMIIVAFGLPEEILSYLMDFKLSSRKPFVFILPDIFQPDIENNDMFFNMIKKSIGKIVN